MDIGRDWTMGLLTLGEWGPGTAGGPTARGNPKPVFSLSGCPGFHRERGGQRAAFKLEADRVQPGSFDAIFFSTTAEGRAESGANDRVDVAFTPQISNAGWRASSSSSDHFLPLPPRPRRAGP